MKELSNNHHINKYYKNLKGKVKVMDAAIDYDMQLEFSERIERLSNCNLPVDEYLETLIQRPLTALFDRDQLTILASIPDVRFIRLLERVIEAAEGHEILPWARLCLFMASIRLQQELDDEEVSYVAGALGGADDKIRHYFLLFPVDERGFTESQINLTREELRLGFDSIGARCESIETCRHFVGITALIPLSTEIEQVFEDCIAEINQYGQFLLPAVHQTNTHIPSLPEISAIRKELFDMVEKTQHEATSKK